MSRWFRHYAGMMRDEKLVRAAVKSKQPVERVVWVWGAILESAAEINDGGRFEFDCGEAAYFLRCDESELAGIIASLEGLGRLSDGVVARWGDRQFASDGAAERQRRYRERRAGGDAANGNGDHNGDAESDVTPPSRDGGVTPQETETNTKTERSNPRASVPEPEARALFNQVWEAFPQNPTSSETKAEKAFNATKAEDRPAILAAALLYRQWWIEDCENRKRTQDEGAPFVPHLVTWISGGDWRKASSLPLRSSLGKADPDLAVIDAGSPDYAAIKRLRGKAPIVGQSGRVTVTKAELEQARQAVH
jgi:hypothetical protein